MRLTDQIRDAAAVYATYFDTEGSTAAEPYLEQLAKLITAEADELLRATVAEAEAWATEAGLTLDDPKDPHGTFARIRQYVKDLDK